MSFGYVYLICDPTNDLFKIGVTRNMKSNRLKKLQTGNPTELHIVKTYYCQYPFRMEKLLHIFFREKHVFNEWFNLDIVDIASFEAVCEAKANFIKSMSDNIFFMKNIK